MRCTATRAPTTARMLSSQPRRHQDPTATKTAERPANRSPQTETSSSTVSISAGPFRVITARHNESASHVEPFASMHHQPRRRPHRQKTQRLTRSVGGTPPRYHAAVAPNRNEIRGHARGRKKRLSRCVRVRYAAVLSKQKQAQFLRPHDGTTVSPPPSRTESTSRAMRFTGADGDGLTTSMLAMRFLAFCWDKY